MKIVLSKDGIKREIVGLPMHLKPVKSSNIKAVGYDPGTKKLRVQFHSGAIHEYDDVPANHHANMCHDRCESVGSYFHTHIKLGGFKSKKIEEE